MLTATQITAGKKATRYSQKGRRHEYDDCIRMAYEWLDAQTKTKALTKKLWP